MTLRLLSFSQVIHIHPPSLRLFSKIIDFKPSRNILSTSRTDTERAAMVMLRGTGRGGPQSLSGPRTSSGIDRLRSFSPEGERGRTTARGADGSSECPGVSTHERGEVGDIDQPWDIQQADKSIRVRNAGERLLPRPRFSCSDLRSLQLSHCPCAVDFRTACGMPAWLAGGRESGLLPSVPHAPSGDTDDEKSGEPWRQRHPGR